MPSDSQRTTLGISEDIPVFVIEREGQGPEIHAADRTIITVEEEEKIALPDSDSASTSDQLRAAKLTQLSVLIQEFPAEAQLIMAAVEDGLTIGPARITEVMRSHD